ncbi:hypothetical protein [Streptomyces sp. NPDC048612]|uniref:hypothetical protein n=1 Tax=Streptomyces sp. NPDC048612 TaxID=3365579 RepID=UPI0037225479
MTGRPQPEWTNVFAETLKTMKAHNAMAVLAYVLYGSTPQVIGQQLGITTFAAYRLLHQSLSALRHPSRSQGLREYSDGEVVVDSELRTLIRHWDMERFAPVCAQCASRYQPDHLHSPYVNYRGRPRKYCSNRCRQAAYRARCGERNRA